MKKDIERIKAIQQSSEEEKTIFLTPILKHNFKTQLLAYSFVPNLEEKVWEMAHKTLLSYQETTPILFPFYLSREIHRTIQEETAAYLQEKKISIEPKILAFFQLKLSQLEGKFLTDSQITSILSIPESQVAHIEKEIKFYQEQYQEEVERLFPQYQEKLEQRKSYYNKVLNAYKHKSLENTITEEELVYLAHYLGGEEDICLDVPEIARLFRKTEEHVHKVLRSGAFKVENDVDTKETLLERYPACKDVYAIRIPSLLEKRKDITVTKYKVEVPKEKPKEQQKREDITVTKRKVEVPKEKPKEKQEKQNIKRSTNQKTTTPIQATLNLTPLEKNLLTELLQRNEHGFYPTSNALSKKLEKQAPVINVHIHHIQAKLKNTFCYHSICEEIPNFQILWEDFLDSRTQKALSKKQVAILENRYERLQDGSYRTRSNEEIAKLISTELLPVDAIFVEKNLKSIQHLFYTYKEVKDTFYKTHPHIPEKNDTQQKLTSTELKVLTQLLQRDEHGFYSTYQEAVKKLGKTINNVKNYSYSLQRKLKSDDCYHSVCEEIPNFQILWDDFLDSKTQKALSKKQVAILENRYERLQDGSYRKRSNEEIAKLISTELLPVDAVFVEKNLVFIQNLFHKHKELKDAFYKNHPQIPRKVNTQQKLTLIELKVLTELLQREEHGFYRTISEIAKELGKTTNHVKGQFYSLQRKLKDASYYHSVCEKIPNFQILWEDFLDSRTQKALSKKQVAILENRYERFQDGSYRTRSNEEIAKLISTELLPVDAIFVEKNLTSIFKLFHTYKEVKEQFYKTHPHIPRKANTQQKLTSIEFSLLTELLQRDEHGFYRSISEIAKEYGKATTVIYRQLNNMQRKLKGASCYHYICEKIPNFQILWEDFLDSKTQKALSKKQVAILENRYERLQDGSYRKRSNEEIAKLISTELYPVDAVFVEKNFKIIQRLFYSYKEVKDAFYKTHATYPDLLENVQIRDSLDEKNAIASKLEEKQISINASLSTLFQKLQQTAFLEDEHNLLHVKKIYAHLTKLEQLLTSTITNENLSLQDRKRSVSGEKEGKASKPKQTRNMISLTEEEIQILRSIAQFDYEKGTYKTQVAREKERNVTQPTLSLKETAIRQKLQDESLQKIFFQNYPDVAQDYLTYLNFSLIKKQEDSSKDFLETSCFHDFLQTCTEEQKEILALRLGYQDGILHKTEEVALKYHVKEEAVQSLTKACLYAGKDFLLAQTKKEVQKRK